MRKTLSTLFLLLTAFFFGVTALALYQGVDEVAAGDEGLQAALQLASNGDTGTAVERAPGDSGAETDGGSVMRFPRQVYQAASSSVVYISTVSVSYQFDFFLRPQERKREGVGSGFIISEDGYILTNSHVVSGADEIEVVLEDGTSYEGRLVGHDPGTDLALLKIGEPGESFPAVTIGDSEDLTPGDWVSAIGNPFGLDRTITVGVVSALDRTIQSEQGQYIRGLIQTDASINRGNSGGPLLNTQGEVVGVSSAIVSRSGGSEGIGLAIPINLAMDVVEQLRTEGRVVRPWLGVEVEEVNSSMARRFDLPVERGLVVRDVYQESPAAKSGMTRPYVDREQGELTYYIITAVNGQEVSTLAELQSAIRSADPGDTVNLTLYESGERVEMAVALEEMPEEAYQAAARLA